MSQYIKVSKIGASYRSDHSLVTLELNFTNIFHGKSYWINTNSLLTELEYLKTINKKNLDVKKQYVLPVYNINEIDNIPNTEIEFNRNDQLF